MERLLEIEISTELNKSPLSRGNIAAKIARANAVSQILTLCDEVSEAFEIINIKRLAQFIPGDPPEFFFDRNPQNFPGKPSSGQINGMNSKPMLQQF